MQGSTNSMQGNSAARPMRVHLAALDHSGSVVIHDSKELIKGSPLDISETGMFVETKSMPFKISQRVQVTVKIPGLLRPFSQECVVTRANKDARYPLGFGLRFVSVPGEIRDFFGEQSQTSWGECFLLTAEQRAKKILLVDSDREFNSTLETYAAAIGIHLDIVEHLGVFPDLKAIDAYDTLLVCDDLEPFSGMEIAEILSKHLPEKPIVLLTTTRCFWDSIIAATPNVVGLTNKWDGSRAIFSHVLKQR